MTRTKSQIGKWSRAKGERFMCEVANAMRAMGLPAAKRSQYRGGAKDGCDIEDSPWFIECKVGADPNPRAAYLQALRDRQMGDLRPIVVVWKQDRRDAMVTMAWRTLSAPRILTSDEHGPLCSLRFSDWLDLVAV